MKSTFSTIITSSLLAATIAIGSSVPAKADTLQINLSDATNTNTQNYPTVKVTVDDTSNPGQITVKVDVVPGSGGYVGDLRGVYFNLPGVSNLAINAVSGGPLTATSTNGDFRSFSNSADLEGTQQSFNVGAEIGRQGIADGDDYRSTTFTISGSGLSLNSFTSQTVGVRLMSVGSLTGTRDDSSKTLGTAPATVTVTNPPASQETASNNQTSSGNPSNHVSVPEPATLVGLGLVGASLGILRRKFNKKA